MTEPIGRDPALRRRLETLTIGSPDCALTFEARLARDNDRFARVDRSAHWLLPRPPAVLGWILVAPMFLVACSRDDGEFGFWFYVQVAFAVYLVYRVLKWLGSGGGTGGSGCGTSGCSGCGGGD